MKLEELLGEELYKQVQEKLDAANKDEPDKLKHIRYADLSEGEYVGKGKYDTLSEQLTGKNTELETANGLIEQLKKATKGDESLQNKITEYEGTVSSLQEQLAKTKLNSAIKVALLSEKAVDVDYLTFKLSEGIKEKGSKLELDDNDNIKGWKDMLTDLKTKYPTMFTTDSSTGGKGNKLVDENNKIKRCDQPTSNGRHDRSKNHGAG